MLCSFSYHLILFICCFLFKRYTKYFVVSLATMLCLLGALCRDLYKILCCSSQYRGHGGRVVTLSPPTSEAGV